MDLPTPFDIPGTGNSPVKYWLQLIATPNVAGTKVGWELNFDQMIGSTVRFQNASSGGWLSQNGLDGVFALHGICTETEGCHIPETVTVSDITIESAVISWVGSDAAQSYLLEYGPAGFTPGEGTEIAISDGSTTATLTDLEVVTWYDVYIKTLCADGESINTVPLSFITADVYCEMNALEVIEPITYVEFAGIANTSGAELDAYPGQEFYLDQTATVYPDSTYTIIVQGNTDVGYTDAISAFIDWNQDHVFSDPGERYDIGLIDNSNGTDDVSAENTITVPADAVPGITRMRIVKEFYFNEYPLGPCTWVSYGQIEDYSVDVQVASGLAGTGNVAFAFGPNPATDYIHIEAGKNIDLLAVYDLSGRKLINREPNAASVKLDISTLSAGTYFITATISGTRKSYKLIVE